MEKIKIVINKSFSGTSVNADSNSQTFALSNNYYSYQEKPGGNIVNDNNVKNFLNDEKNEKLAQDFVNHLQIHTSVEEFKEIYYDNKKLASTFNNYYNTNIRSQSLLTSENAIGHSVGNMTARSIQSNNFHPNTNSRINAAENILFNESANEDNYCISVRLQKNFNTVERGDYNKYINSCHKEGKIYRKITYYSNANTQTINGNSVYLKNLNNQASNFGNVTPENELFGQQHDITTISGTNNIAYNYNFLTIGEFFKYFSSIFEVRQFFRNGFFKAGI